MNNLNGGRDCKWVKLYKFVGIQLRYAFSLKLVLADYFDLLIYCQIEIVLSSEMWHNMVILLRAVKVISCEI